MQSLFRRLWGHSRKNESFPVRSPSGRLCLSPVSSVDHAMVTEWFSDPDSCRLAFGVETDSETLACMTHDYLNELSQDSSGVLMIRTCEANEDEPALGFLRYKLFRQSRRRLARVGIMLGRAQHRGQGLGTEAMQTLLRLLFSFHSVDMVELDTAHFNQAAQSCFLKCGFQIIRETEILGLHNRWSERRIIMRLSADHWRRLHPAETADG